MPTITHTKFKEYKADQDFARWVRGGRLFSDNESLKLQNKKRGLTIVLLACTQIVTLFILFF